MQAPLPAWVFDGPVANRRAHARRLVERRRKALRAAQRRCRSTSASTSPRTCSARARRRRCKAGTELFKNDEVRVWTLDGEVLIASITAKLHLISPTVAEGPAEGASSMAEAGYKGLVIWSPDDVFSAGANLEALMPVFMKRGAKGIAPEVKKLQDVDAAPALRAGAGGRARCAASRSAAAASWRCTRARRVAAMESYIGLVEVGVGLMPGGGGLTYIARRAAEMAARRQRQRRHPEVR